MGKLVRTEKMFNQEQYIPIIKVQITFILTSKFLNSNRFFYLIIDKMQVFFLQNKSQITIKN